jgi:hypothetical protein
LIFFLTCGSDEPLKVGIAKLHFLPGTKKTGCKKASHCHGNKGPDEIRTTESLFSVT